MGVTKAADRFVYKSGCSQQCRRQLLISTRSIMVHLSISLVVALVLCQQVVGQEQKITFVNKILPVLKEKLVYNETEFKLLEQKNKPKIDFFPNGTRPQSAGAGMVRILPTGQIVGGFRAARGQFPWQVYIVMDKSSSCGGSLISPQWILTAAHCVLGFSDFEITLGSAKRNIVEAGRINVVTKHKFIHHGYNDQNLQNDIALLRLNSPINITGPFINTIRLPKVSDGSRTFVNTNGVVSGWGKTSDAGTVTVQLNYVTIPVISNVNCSAVYGAEYIKPTMMCVSGANNKGICSGDSGGPLVVKESDGQWSQIGIVSFSAYSCHNYPQGFTRVTSFMGWISNHTGIQFRK
ncbi:brachyurin-like isoform X2 [Neocloeon triangulifer]|uniref:brachyurin-like isoform X2 n=1 Tax=Neocloeon triangulifer TaxID=2078957 RepID=UPI00286F0ED8|nr:brachyurin-like isoform X2 [Neocloeon triangulifer]